MLKNLLLTACSLALFLGACELAATLYLRHQNPPATQTDALWNMQKNAFPGVAEDDPKLGYRLKPGARENGLTSNALGLRGKEIFREKGKNVFRIICLGGSTTIGSNVQDYFTYPNQLQIMFDQALKNCAIRVEVLNAGMFGYTSANNLVYAKEYLDALDPDMYLVMDGLNDLIAASKVSFSDMEAVRGNFAKYNPLVGGKRAAPSLAGDFMRFFDSLSMTKAAKELVYAVTKNAGLADYFIKKKFALFGYKENMAALIAHEASRGTDVVLINHPWIVNTANSPEEDEKRMPHPFPDQSYFHLYRTGRGLIAATDAELQRELHVTVIDPQGAIDKAAPDLAAAKKTFNDTMHFTRYGNFILAGTIFEALLARGPLADRLAASSCKPVPDMRVFAEILNWSPDDLYANWDDVAACAPRTASVTMENVASREENGWTVLTPQDPARPGVIRIGLDEDDIGLDSIIYFPRLSGKKDEIEVFALGPASRELLARFTDPGDSWTNVLSKTPLPVRDGHGSLECVLRGENAQLWTRGALFFWDHQYDR